MGGNKGQKANSPKHSQVRKVVSSPEMCAEKENALFYRGSLKCTRSSRIVAKQCRREEDGKPRRMCRRSFCSNIAAQGSTRNSLDKQSIGSVRSSIPEKVFSG